MELLNLLLYIIVFTQLSYSQFLNFYMINIFIKNAYENKQIANSQNINFFSFLIILIQLILSIINYYINIFISNCKKNTYGKYIIYTYDFLNKTYLNFCNKFDKIFFQNKNKIINDYFMQIIYLKKNMENIENIEQNKKKLHSNSDLCTPEKINIFLNKILLKSKLKNLNYKNE